MTALDFAVVLVGFLTAALSGAAGLGGGTILIGVFYALGMPPNEAVPLFAAVQFVANSSRTVAYIRDVERSEEHTSELQSLMRISYAVFCLKKKSKISRRGQKNK